MKMYRRLSEAVVFGLLIIVAVCAGSPAWGQEKYPSKPINIIVSWAPGGLQDIAARGMQPLLQKALGQNIVITNKTGGGGAIGFTEIANAAPDGYTIGHLSPSVNILKYTTKANIDYTRFEPIMFGGYTPVTLFVRKEAPWKNLTDFLAFAKANSQKPPRVGNSGNGAIYHISAINMERAAGVKFTHVPFAGGAPAIPALFAGQLDAAALSLTDGMQMVKSGKIRAVGVAAPDRSQFIPDVQTFKELGMNVEDISYFAWAGPKGMAKDRVRILYEALKKGVESKEFKAHCDHEAVTITTKGPEELAKFLAKEDVKWRDLIKSGGIKAE